MKNYAIMTELLLLMLYINFIHIYHTLLISDCLKLMRSQLPGKVLGGVQLICAIVALKTASTLRGGARGAIWKNKQTV